jgi:hypothetical protein
MADGGHVGSRLAILALVVTCLAALPARAAAATTGAYWGTAAAPLKGQTQLQTLQQLESETGRRFRAFRFYLHLDNASLSSDVARVMKARGVPLYVNINSQVRGTCVPWRAVAAGRYNADLVHIARSVKGYGHKVFFSWNHEMEANCSTGTPAEYRASYARIRRVFRSQGVHNAVFVFTACASNYSHDPARIAAYLPVHYDLIGVDGYNRSGGWSSASTIFAGARAFAAKRGKRLFIGEVGSAEDSHDATAKARWIAAATATFRSWNVAAVMWVNSNRAAGDYRADSSAAALRAYRQAGQLGFYAR